MQSWRIILQRTLQLLIALQGIERKVQSLLEQKARTPKLIASLKEEKEEAEMRLTEQKVMLETTRKSGRQLEQELEDLEVKKTRSKQKLLGVKSNKEYQATLKEIEDLEELLRGREDQILEQMESAEQIQKEILEQERVLAEARQKLEQEGLQLERDAEKADEQMANLKEQKEKLKPKIPAELLKKYQFLRANRAGIALAPVNRGTCQVCHMNLPPQLYIDLQRNEKMIHCPNCQRIIYWVGHPAYQLSSQILAEQD
jgi:predicted  nucleic acid-binding Zn-ribbon protein